MTKLIIIFAVLCILIIGLVIWRYESLSMVGPLENLLDRALQSRVYSSIITKT